MQVVLAGDQVHEGMQCSAVPATRARTCRCAGGHPAAISKPRCNTHTMEESAVPESGPGRLLSVLAGAQLRLAPRDSQDHALPTCKRSALPVNLLLKSTAMLKIHDQERHADALAGAQLRPAPPAEAPAPPCAPLFLSPSKALDTTGRIAAANAQLSAFRAALTKARSPF